jgi:hypothetical protein
VLASHIARSRIEDVELRLLCLRIVLETMLVFTRRSAFHPSPLSCCDIKKKSSLNAVEVSKISEMLFKRRPIIATLPSTPTNLVLGPRASAVNADVEIAHNFPLTA